MPKYLEIGIEPWVKRAFPEDTVYVDTKISWKEIRSYEALNMGLVATIKSLIHHFLVLIQLAWKQDYEVVITRCLGTVNSKSSFAKHLAKKTLNHLFLLIILFAARGGKKLVVIDLLNHQMIRPSDFILLKRSHLYFKTELAGNIISSFEAITPLETCVGHAFSLERYLHLAKKLRPMPLGIESQDCLKIDFSKKKWDFFYVGSDSGVLTYRLQTNQILDQLKEKGYRVLHRQQIPREDFLQCIQDSWLCISPGGMGWDCYRHYQIPACGSCPIFIAPTISMYEPYLHEKTAFYIHPFADWGAQLESFIQDKEKLMQMTKDAQDHLLKHHTFQQLGAYIVNEIEKEAKQNEA